LTFPKRFLWRKERKKGRNACPSLLSSNDKAYKEVSEIGV
jgi:hypothetical protein